MHELIAHLVQEGSQKNLVPNMASGIHRHRPSHLTKGAIFPLNYTILTSHIGRRKLVFETQITTKGFELRVFKFTALSLQIARTTSPFLSFFNLKIRSRTKPNVSPLLAKKKTQA
jgi:hypothetical protein